MFPFQTIVAYVSLVVGILALVVGLISLDFHLAMIRQRRSLAESLIRFRIPIQPALIGSALVFSLWGFYTFVAALFVWPPFAELNPALTSIFLETIVDDFEKDANVWEHADTWEKRDVALPPSHTDDAAVGSGALRCEFDSSSNFELNPRVLCFRSFSPPANWADHEFLAFFAKVDLNGSDFEIDPSKYGLQASIALATGTESCWNELGQFHPVGTQFSTFTYNLSKAAYKNCVNDFSDYNTRLTGSSEIRRFHIIFQGNNQFKAKGAFVIDHVRLIKTVGGEFRP